MPPHEHDKGRDDRRHDELLQQTWNGPSGVRRPHGPALGPARGHHGPHGHHHHPGLPPHVHGGGHFRPRSGMGGPGGDGFSGRAADILGTILPPDVANWLLRSVSFGPPEIVAIFKVEIAAIDADLARRQAAGIEARWFSPEDIQAGEDTLHAMSATMSDNETAACLHNLFWGPDEVQAIAFLSLVVLRLNAADPAAQLDEA